MTTTPRPAQVHSDLSQIVNVLSPAILKAYRWAYNVRFEASRRSGGGKGSDPTDPVSQAVCQCQPGHRGTCGRCIARGRIDHAARMVSQARSNLLGALRDLERALDAADTGDHATLTSEHDVRIPRTASVTDIADAKRAALKRARRGEGYGAA